MHHNQLIIDLAREIYLKHNGTDHRAIEREMRAKGCLSFSRRVFHGQQTPRGYRPGWIELYGWREVLEKLTAETRRRREKKNKIMDSLTDRVTTDPFTSDSTDEKKPSLSPRLGVSAVKNISPNDFQSWLKRIAPTMNWDWAYQQIIYEQLERITSGESRRLMIFLPPRHGKSELVTNRYAAWRLKQNPKMNIILGSYNQRLANRFSRKVRITFEDALAREEGEKGRKGEGETPDSDEITNSNFTERSQEGGLAPADSTSSSTPERVSNSPASSPHLPFSSSPLLSRRHRLNTVSEWETGMGGGVRAVGVGGGITGFGADLVIIDDPIKSRAEAESKTYRERVWDWFNDDLYTRLEPNAAIILIQTRWHEDDLAGTLLREASEEGGEHWDVISLPALSEPPALAGGQFHDRSSPPKLIDLHKNEDADRETGSTISNGSANTEVRYISTSWPPAYAGGSDPLGRQPGEALCPERFSKDDLERIKRKLGSYSFSALYQQRPTPPEGGLFKRSWFTRIVNRPPENLRWARGYDLAVSTKDSADFTASFRCALDRQTGDLYIADGFRKRIEFPEQKRFIIERIRQERNTEHGIEQALHAQAFVQELRRQPGLITRPIRLVRPAADKFTRALSWANLAEEGKVVLVRGSGQPNWIDAFLEEICTFPNSTHDDQLDAVSTAVQMLERHNRTLHMF